MLKKWINSGLVGASLSLVMGAAVADGDQGLMGAVKNGDAHLSFRLRYEDVAVDTAGGTASNDAITLKTRLSYKTAAYKGFTGFLEFDDITAADGDYISAAPGIADPEGSEVNQAWLGYNNWDTGFKWGRQRITMDNHRFVGHVGWRQNEQTYDAFSIANTSVENLALSYAHISNVNRIFGESSPVGDHAMDTHLLNAKYKAGKLGSVSAYAYLLESGDGFAPFKRWNTDTYGVRWTNSVPLDSVKLAYTLEYATQSAGDDNPLDYGADYLHGELSAVIKPVKVTVGLESLGADGSSGQFITPLATLYKFQGWTDKFLNLGLGNIAEGIVDTYLSAATTVGGVKLMVVYHDFTSDEDNASGDSDLGSEIGALVGKKWGNYGAELRYASYSAGDSTAFNGGGLTLTDTQKIWLTLSAKF